MAEHHIHVHIHGSQPDNNEQALVGLASAGKQAQAQSAYELSQQLTNQTQSLPAASINTAQASELATAILAGAIIGRKRGETSKETAVEVAKDILELIVEQFDAEPEAHAVVAAATIAAGYLSHGRGVYQKLTIAERAVEAYSLI